MATTLRRGRRHRRQGAQAAAAGGVQPRLHPHRRRGQRPPTDHPPGQGGLTQRDDQHAGVRHGRAGAPAVADERDRRVRRLVRLRTHEHQTQDRRGLSAP